jgi:hypothetical protein
MEPIKDQIAQGLISSVGAIILIAALIGMAWWVVAH